MFDEKFLQKRRILMKTFEFVESVLVFGNKRKEEKERTEEVKFLEEVSVFLLGNLVNGCGGLRGKKAQKCLKITQKCCIQCILILTILKNKGSIGPMAHTALSSQVEQIAQILPKITPKVEGPPNRTS